jgi:zinc transporter ZupT
MGIANSFSGGIFLCVALLHLLPESAEIFENYYDNKSSNSHSNVIEPHIEKRFPMSFLLTFIGYTLILMIEKIIFDSQCHNYSDDGVNDEIVGDDEASRLNTTNFKEFNSMSKNTNAYGNYNLSINNYFDTNSKRNKFLPIVEENNFDKYKTRNNIEKAKTSILSSSIRDSFSKASKTYIINNYFNNFKSNSIEKKEEYFKNIFTTSGRISTLLIVNDRI